MKKSAVIVVMIGCLLLFTNLSAAATTFVKQSPVHEKEVGIVSIATTDLVPLSPAEEEETTSFDTLEEDEKELEVLDIITIQQPYLHGQSQTFAVADAGGPYSGQKDSPITFDGSHCFCIPGSTHTWDFGDDNDRTLGYGLYPTHTYSREGVYYATLTVTKSNGDTYLDLAPVYVGQDNDHLFPYGGCNYKAETDEQIIFDASQSISTDPGAYPLKYRWNFGDGSEYTSWSTDPTTTYSYERERVYKIKLEIKDKYGNTRCDVLHADIGCSFSTIQNLFINGDSIFDDILSILFDDWEGGMFFCQWFNVKIYTKYNEIEKYTSIYSFNDAQNKKIDVNNDGIDDVRIGGVTFFRLLSDSPRASPFNSNIESYQFETTFSNIQLLSSGAIGFADEFTICLQFTFPPIIADNYETFGLAEPTVKIGYHMNAEKEKPYQQISVTHVFRPFLLAKLGLMSNGNSQQNNTVPNGQQNVIIAQQSAQASVRPIGITKGAGLIGTGSTTTMTTSLTTMNEQMNAQQQNPIMSPLENSGVYPEHGVIIDGITGEAISLIGIVENNEYTTTLEITFESIFTPFTLTHRRGDTCRDIDLSGSDASSVAFSITRENTQGSVTLGMLINPIEYLGFHLDIRRENNERQLTFNIDNPPENVILFTETEDAQGQHDGKYLYMTHPPEIIELRWLPRLDEGYIALDINQGSSDFEIGLCDDLEEPETKVFLSNIPATVDLSWQIMLEQPRSIALSSNITGLTLNAELKDVTQPNHGIDFQATVEDALQLTFEWSLPDGYFSLQRSTTTIFFDFFFSQESATLDIFGTYTAGEGDGLTFTFPNLEQGVIEIGTGKTVDMHLSAENLQTTATLSTDITFAQEGQVKLEWDESTSLHLNASHALTFSQFDLSAPQVSLTADEIGLASASHFNVRVGDELQLGGENQVTLSNIDAALGNWSGTLASGQSVGDFDIILRPYEKYCEVDVNNNLALEDIRLVYDSPLDQYDTTFSIATFDTQHGSTLWFDFMDATPKFDIQGMHVLDLVALDLAIGSAINFSIPSFEIGGSGHLYSEFNAQHFYVSSDVNVDWDLDIHTVNYGEWYLNGTFSGNGTMDVTEWQPGHSGQVTFSVLSPVYHSLELIHGDLVINIGNINLSSGSLDINWEREALFESGKFNLTNNGISGSLSLLKLSYDDAQDPIAIELGDLTIQPGTFSIDWLRKASNRKIFHIENSLIATLGLVKAAWDDKTVTIGNLGLTPGEFKFTWDTLNNRITINNGMAGLGPLCSYEDSERKLSMDLTNLVSDYSKTMELRWFEVDEKVIGVSLDTDDTDLVDWIEFESIRYDPTEATGRRIALNGLKADNFKIMKNTEGKLEISGKLYIASGFTYSRLTDLENDTWEDLTVTWDLQNDLKMITMSSEFDPAIKLLSAELLGITFTSEVTLTDYLQVKWKLDTPGQKEFHLDTDGNVFSSLSFSLVGPNGKGIEIVGGGLWADDFYVTWQLWPPQEFDVSSGGDIGYDTATVYGTVDYGTTWIEIWPFASGSQHT